MQYRAQLGDAKLVGAGWANRDNVVLLFAKTAAVSDFVAPRQEWCLASDLNVANGKLRPLLENQGDGAMNTVLGWPQVRTVGGAPDLYLMGMTFPDQKGVLTVFKPPPAAGLAREVAEGTVDTRDILVDSDDYATARADYVEDSGLWSLWTRTKGAAFWQQRQRQVYPIDTPSLEVRKDVRTVGGVCHPRQ